MRKSVSVAMACYNGEKYIQEQLVSILKQIDSQDEIVISLDPCKDHTKEIIESFQDPRIKMIDGPGKGVVKNFENAISHTKNEIIFLCDQDDVWAEDKVDTVLELFKDTVCVVLHDAKIVDQDLNVLDQSYFALRGTQLGIMKSLIKNTYIGCCMAFSRQLKDIILPFPEPLYMHDQYIGIAGELYGTNVLCEKTLLYYRRHENNVTEMKHLPLFGMIKKRIEMILAIKELKRRIKK